MRCSMYVRSNLSAPKKMVGGTYNGSTTRTTLYIDFVLRFEGKAEIRAYVRERRKVCKTSGPTIYWPPFCMFEQDLSLSKAIQFINV